MNINPRTWFTGRKSNDIGSSALARAAMAMGPWTPQINGFVPREVNPWFLEALRSSLGVLDGAINRLVTMDGIVAVEGGNDKLTQLIQRELIDSIPVGDLQTGLQAFYAAQGGEMYEQGCTIGEMVFDRRGRELIGLRVADSKGILFHRDMDNGQLQTWYLPPMPNTYGRRDGTDAIEHVLRNNGRQLNAQVIQGKGYTLLDPARIVYASFNHENDQPYGVSLLRGIEFVGQILLKMHNATGQAWDRFGDPIFHIAYKTKNRALKDGSLDKRRAQLANDLQTALNAKRSGNSADFTTAVAADDDVAVSIIGGDGKVLSIEMPARHMLEQVLAKVGLPPWMLGIQLGTAERMADNQAEVVLQESKTRWEARGPGLNRVVETWLRGRGLTWRPGDWKLVQNLPNLRDELKRAQAAFLNAQTQMMLANSGGANPAFDTGTDRNTGNDAPPGSPAPAKPRKDAALVLESFADPVVRAALKALLAQPAANCDHGKAATGTAPAEPWAVDDPNLPRIEGAAISTLLTAWAKLRDDTLRTLGLPTGTGKAGEVAWSFDAMAWLNQLQQLLEVFIVSNGSKDSAFVAQVFEAWVRGVENAAASVDREAEAATVIMQSREAAKTGIADRISAQFRTTAMRTYTDDIIKILEDGSYNGQSPKTVAYALKKRFKGHDYDWERLASSELALAQSRGQEDMLMADGYEWYDFDAASDACPICKAKAEGGPYKLGEGPLPMRDTHPECRCAIKVNLDGPTTE